MSDVDLTWSELRAAAYVGIDRFIRARAKHRQTVNGQSRDDMTAHILGACGERVAAKLLGRYWVGDLGCPDYGAPDVGPWHIRTRAEHWQDLPLYDNDRDSDPFLLVVVLTLPRFRVVGWVIACDGKRPEYFTVADKRRPPAYFVPQSALRPLSEWST